MNKEESRKILWPMILIGSLITSYGVCFKYTNLARNIDISNSILIFPITFLMSLMITRYFGKKFARKTINMAVISFVVFIIGMIFISFFRSNDASAAIRASIEFIFIPKHTEAFGLTFNYPILLHFGFFIGAFYLSHFLAITLYDITSKMVPKVFSFGLGYFLAYIIFSIIYVGGYNTIDLIQKDNFKLIRLVRILTAQFIGLFISGIIMIIIFTIISSIIKLKKDNKDEKSEIKVKKVYPEEPTTEEKVVEAKIMNEIVSNSISNEPVEAIPENTIQETPVSNEVKTENIIPEATLHNEVKVNAEIPTNENAIPTLSTNNTSEDIDEDLPQLK